ncbi:MAG: hypothetical protein C0514_04120 [Candidatus Puniceispirillum sp.]|nr:hypothetical protein [Candidatus Puniceispirillum sp.]
MENAPMKKNTLLPLIFLACASFTPLGALASDAIDESEAEQKSRKRTVEALCGEKHDAKRDGEAHRKRRRLNALLEAACAKSADYSTDDHPVLQLCPMQSFSLDLPIFQFPTDESPFKEPPALERPRRQLSPAEKAGLDHLDKWKDTQSVDRLIHALEAVRIFDGILKENQSPRPQVLLWAAQSHFRLGMSAMDAETKAHFLIAAQLCERLMLAREKPTLKDKGFTAAAYLSAAKHGAQEQKLHYACASANLFDKVVWSDAVHSSIYVPAAHAHLLAARAVSKENKLAFLQSGEKICLHGLDIAPQYALGLREMLRCIYWDLSQYYKD